MELELVGGTIEDTGVGPNQSFIDEQGNFVNTYSEATYNELYQPPRQSGFASFMNDFFTPQRINALGGLFTKKPQQFPTPQAYGNERNMTGIVIVSLLIVVILVVAILVLRKRK